MPPKSVNFSFSEHTLSQHKRQRWLICFVILLVGLTLIILLLNVPISKSGTIFVDSPSDRARDFLKTEGQKDNSFWKNMSLNTANSTPSNSATMIQTACFQADLNFPIRSIEKIEPENCLVTLRVSSPPSRLTIMLVRLNSDLDDHSAVLMRNASPKTYSTVNNFSSPYSIFRIFTDPQGVSYFAQIDNQLLSIIFSETTDQNRILNQTLPEVLSALQILPPVTPTLENNPRNPTIEGSPVSPTLDREPPITLQ